MLHPLYLCMAVRLGRLLELLDGEFPFSLALSWDNSGLQVGEVDQQVSSVAVALDPVAPVVNRALDRGADCIVTHHPLIFKPLRRVSTDTEVGRTVVTLVQKGISLVSLHTNLDVAPGGLADHVAGLLGLDVEGPMVVEEEKGLGRVGFTGSPLEFGDFLGLVKEALGVSSLRVVNPPSLGEKRVWKVALCPGSGGDLVAGAAATGAQLYLTGDLKYHQALDATALGVTVIDAGHYGTELPAVELLVSTLRGLVDGEVEVFQVEMENPFKEDLL